MEIHRRLWLSSRVGSVGVDLYVYTAGSSGLVLGEISFPQEKTIYKQTNRYYISIAAVRGTGFLTMFRCYLRRWYLLVEGSGQTA